MNNNQGQKPDNKFYWMKLKKQLSKAGKAYYTGQFAYAVDVIGFEKDDGTITLWLSPKDMDKLKQQGAPTQAQREQRPPGTAIQQFKQAVQQQSRPTPQRPEEIPFVDHTQYTEPPKNPWDDDLPF